MHIPVLLDAVIEALQPGPQSRIIDGTLGAGGHTRALVEAGAEVLGLDWDTSALELARANLRGYETQAHLVHASYIEMAQAARRMGWAQVDGILLDLGLSSMQVDQPERGFAFRHDGPLDMRFDPTEVRPTAAELVNTLSAEDLADIFYRYGEEPASRKLARVVVAARPFSSTAQLAAAIERAIPRRKGDKIHPATRVFQALRIAVNDELENIETVLPQAVDLLRPGGRLAVISFHSLEDRIVKQMFKLASTDCICPPEVPICVCNHRAQVRLVTRKPLVADEAEIALNARSRSAKLRVVEKL